MSLGRGNYANPRDGDVVAFDVEIEHDSVTVRTMTARGCGAAGREVGQR